MLRSLYVDLNSFFASVEQQDNPALRGRPVAVVAVDSLNTACLAASYEAKRLGIKTGTRVGEALRLCPDLVRVPPRTERYLDVHHAVLAAVERVLPIQRVWSIDEVCCPLGPTDQAHGAAEALGRAVKRSILRDVGDRLTSSVGIAPNRWLAKIASDMHKPDGLIVIRHDELPRRLWALAIQDLPGIGTNNATRLLRHGIATVEELCGRSERDLCTAFGGVVGSFFFHALRGRVIHDRPSPTRSVGHEHVLGPERRTHEGARAVLIRLVSKAAARLRGYGYVAGEVTIAARLMDGPRGSAPSLRWGMQGGWHTRIVLQPPCGDTLTLAGAVTEAWDARTPAQRAVPPLKVGVTLACLTPVAGATGSLFGAPAARARISRAMDVINARFGKNAVYVAAMHDTKDSAPPRIAFQHIPDVEV